VKDLLPYVVDLMLEVADLNLKVSDLRSSEIWLLTLTPEITTGSCDRGTINQSIQEQAG